MSIGQHKMRNLNLWLGIMLLSCIDIANTIEILKNGGTELNPFMAWLIGFDDGYRTFAAVKLLLTAFGAYVLAVYNQIKLMYVVTALYIMLVIYQIYLLVLVNGYLY